MGDRRNDVTATERLGDIAGVQMGYSFRSRLEHDPQGTVLVIQMKDIEDVSSLRTEGVARVSLPPGRKHHLLRPGDVVFRSRGRSNGAALVPGGIGVAVLAAPMLLIRPYGVLPDYLCWFLNTPAAQAQLAVVAEGTSVRMISAEALAALEVPLPAAVIQHRIAEASALADRERSLMAQIATQRQRLTGHLLMQRARHGARKANP